jgi:hypothetical protein
VVACWCFADLQHFAEGVPGPGRREAAVRDPGAAAVVAVMQSDHKDLQAEAEGPDGLVEVAVAHLRWEEERHASKGWAPVVPVVPGQ